MCSKQVKDVLDYYNAYKNRQRFNTPLEKVEIEEIFPTTGIEILQKEILKFLHEKEIIVETNPTSNLRIGSHRSFETYQLFKWLKWQKEGNPLPPIILGSDDPGIFATNIYNEYASVYCYLVYSAKISRSEVMEFIKTLVENSRNYRFSR